MDPVISSFTNARFADGTYPSNESEEHVLAFNGRDVELVAGDRASGELAESVSAARTTFCETVRRTFGGDVAETVLRDLDQTRPLNLRSVMSVVNRASMMQNIRQALSAKAMALPPARTVKDILSSVRFAAGGDKAVAMRAEIEDLAAHCDGTFEELVHKHTGKELGKALLAGEGRVYAAYEAHYDALTVLSVKLRLYVEYCLEEEGKLFGDGVSATDASPLATLQEAVDGALGTLSRTAAVLAEGARRGEKDFAGDRLRKLLSPAEDGRAAADARSPAAIAFALGDLFEAVDAIGLGTATQQDVAALRTRIGQAMTQILGGKTTSDVNRLALRQFAWQLADADAKLKDLAKALAKQNQLPQVTAALRKGETVTKVMNGEMSVNYLVEMKALGVDDRALDPLFAEKNLEGGLKPLGSGAINTVSIGTYKDPETGRVVQGVVKMADSADRGLAGMALGRSLFNQLSPEQAKSLKRNVAVKRASNFIKCGPAVTTASATSVKGKLAIVQEVAPGKTSRTLNNKKLPSGDRELSCGVGFVSLTSGCLDSSHSLTDEQRLRLYEQVLVQGNRLAFSDYLTGQLDRHTDNLMFDVSGDLSNGRTDFVVSLKGIDNDCAFPVSRIGFRKFKLTGPSLAKLSEGIPANLRPAGFPPIPGFGDLARSGLANRQPPALVLADDGSATIDLGRMTTSERGQFFDIFAINNLVEPAFAMRDTYDAVMAEGAREKFAAEMSGLVDGPELEAALARFDDLKALLVDLAARNLIFTEAELLASSEKLMKLKGLEMDKVVVGRGNRTFENSNRVVTQSYALTLLGVQDFGVSEIEIARQTEEFLRQEAQKAGAAQGAQPPVPPAPEPPQAPLLEIPVARRRHPDAEILAPRPNVPKGEANHPAIDVTTRANYARQAKPLEAQLKKLMALVSAVPDAFVPFLKDHATRRQALPGVTAYVDLLNDLREYLKALPADPADLRARLADFRRRAAEIDMDEVERVITTVRRFSPMADDVEMLRQVHGAETVRRAYAFALVDNTLENSGLGHLKGRFDRYQLIELGAALDKAAEFYFKPADILERCDELLDDALVREKGPSPAMTAIEGVFGTLDGRERVLAELRRRLPDGVSFTQEDFDDFLRSVKPGDCVSAYNELLVDVFADAVASGLVTEEGALSDDRAEAAPQVLAELVAARLERLALNGRLVPTNYDRAAHLERLFDARFPTAGELFRDDLRALVAKEPTRALELIDTLAKFKLRNNKLLMLLHNQPDAAARQDLVRWLELFGHSGEETFALALVFHRDALKAAEARKNAPLSRIEVLKVLLPFCADAIEKEAARIEADPKNAYWEILSGRLTELGATAFAGDDRHLLPAFGQYGTYLVLAGKKTPEEVVTLFKTEAVFDPTQLPQEIFLCGEMANSKSFESVRQLFARDLDGLRPVIRLNVPAAEPGGEPETVVFNADEKIRMGEFAGVNPSEASNAFVDRICRLCGGRTAQASKVILALTQNDSVASLFSALVAKSIHSCVNRRLDITFDPANGDVRVRVTMAPDAPIDFALTRVFHADGTQELVSCSPVVKR